MTDDERVALVGMAQEMETADDFYLVCDYITHMHEEYVKGKRHIKHAQYVLNGK